MRKQEMELKFGYDMQLAQLDVQARKEKEQMIEDRKDLRTRISGTQQSQMIDQRKNNLLPTDFEANNTNNMSDLGVEPLIP